MVTIKAVLISLCFLSYHYTIEAEPEISTFVRKHQTSEDNFIQQPAKHTSKFVSESVKSSIASRKLRSTSKDENARNTNPLASTNYSFTSEDCNMDLCDAAFNNPVPMGACTPYYCSCGNNEAHFLSCGSGQVYDPIRQICNSPSAVQDCKTY